MGKIMPKVLLKVLADASLICMKYATQGESSVAKAKCYICHEILTKTCILSYKCALSVLLYFTL